VAAAAGEFGAVHAVTDETMTKTVTAEAVAASGLGREGDDRQ
jgi:hypothetical protein